MKNLNISNIQDYQIERVLNHGSSATVYLITKDNREYALKYFTDYNDYYIENYNNECHYLQILNHVGIIKILSHGFFENYPYIILPYIEQGDLRKRAEISHKWTMQERIEDALNIFQKSIEVLMYIHQQGLIHRDIKPANILLSPSNDPIIIDFGTVTQKNTKEDLFIGTPSYASPEQLLGRKLDVFTDVFSLGATMYFLLSKQKPFKGRDRTPPTNLHHIDPFIPIPLSDIIQRCFASNPNDRPKLEQIYAICSELETRSKFHVLAGRESVQNEIGYILQQISDSQIKIISLRIIGDSLVDVQWAISLIKAQAMQRQIAIFEIQNSKDLSLHTNVQHGIIIDHSGMYNCQYEIFFPPLRIAEIRRSLYAHLPQMHDDLAKISYDVEYQTGGNPDLLVQFIKTPNKNLSKNIQLQLSKLAGFEIDILSLLAQTLDSICLEDFLNIQSPEIKKAFIDLQKKGLIRHTYAGRWCLYRESLREEVCKIFHLSLPSITSQMRIELEKEINVAQDNFEKGRLYIAFQKIYHSLDRACCIRSVFHRCLIYKYIGVFHLRIGDFNCAEQNLADAAVLATFLTNTQEIFDIDIYRSIINLEKNNSKSGSILTIERLIRSKGNKNSTHFNAICAWATVILGDYRNHQRCIHKYYMNIPHRMSSTDLFFLQYVIRSLKIQEREDQIQELLKYIPSLDIFMQWEYSKILPQIFEHTPIGSISIKLPPKQLLFLKNRWKKGIR